MPVPYRSKEPKRKYAKISLKKRQNLVDLVMNQGQSLTKTAKKLNLKLSTAKLILRKYKQTGKFHIRKLRRHALPTEEAPQIQQEQEPIVKFQQCPQKNTEEAIQEPALQTTLYPFVYGDMCYPYFSCYGAWGFENFFQIN